MYSNEKGKTEIIVILIIITMGIMLTSSAVILVKTMGKENVMYSLQNLGIIRSVLEKNERAKEIDEELYEFPYLNLKQEDSAVLKGLNHNQKMMYFKMKKSTNLNINELRAVVDLTQKLNMRYDYFVAAIMSIHEYNYELPNSYIYSLTYASYKSTYDKYLKDQSLEYRQVILRGVYFHYLATNYKYDDLDRFFTEFYMGKYEANQYSIRNESYVTYFSSQCKMSAGNLTEIYRYFLKSLI